VKAEIDAVAELLRGAAHVVVSTGAGVSAESGVPTFRDAQSGLWARFDAQTLATPEAFADDPDLVWGWYTWRRRLVTECAPNPAHRAIAELAGLVPRLTLVTQNVDDLHERAGSTGVLHLHGGLFESRCFDCDRSYDGPEPESPDGGRLAPPRCPSCGGPIRPGVVWFGEMLPQAPWEAAQDAAEDCDVLLSVGTSSQVYPAAALPDIARRRGAQVVQVNPDETGIESILAHDLRGPAGVLLPEVLTALRGD